jgi:hypothetical protein
MGGWRFRSSRKKQSEIGFAQIASLSTVIQPNFAVGAITPADAALALALPGQVSSSIFSIPMFSSNVLTVVKKGLKVQKQGGCTGLTTGNVITKMLIPKKYKICLNNVWKTITNSAGEKEYVCANYGVIQVPSNFEVNGKGFSKGMDSGALVTTIGACPQPVGMLVGGKGPLTYVTGLPSVLQALKTAGGYSSLSIVAGGGAARRARARSSCPTEPATRWRILRLRIPMSSRRLSRCRI